MKLLIFFILLSTIDFRKEPPTMVYLCESKTGKKYHYKVDCRGLNNCQHKIVKTTLEIAKKRGKTICGWEK